MIWLPDIIIYYARLHPLRNLSLYIMRERFIPIDNSGCSIKVKACRVCLISQVNFISSFSSDYSAQYFMLLQMKLGKIRKLPFVTIL